MAFRFVLELRDDLVTSIAELDEDQDPWKYVISHNLHRRHLTTSQRAMVASKLANLKRGDNQHTKEDGQFCPSSTEDAAKQLKVGIGTVKAAKQVQEHGSESVKQAVEQGEIPVSLASKLFARRHLTTGQKAAFAHARLEYEREAAKERQEEHGGTAPGKPKITCGNISTSDNDTGKARDKAGASVGVSGRSVDKFDKIKELAPESAKLVADGKAEN